jgi:tetratricopeptide (TPR) repeat protein
LCYLELKKYEQARTYLKESVYRSEEGCDGRQRFLNGKALYYLGEYIKAIKQFEESLETKEKEPARALYFKGLSLIKIVRREKKFHDALIVGKAALALELAHDETCRNYKNIFECHLLIVKVSYEQNLFKEALAYMSENIDCISEFVNAEAWFIESDCYFGLGKYDDARKSLVTAEELVLCKDNDSRLKIRALNFKLKNKIQRV